CYRDNEIELRDNPNILPAPAERTNPIDDLPLIEPRATEPPQVSIRLVVSGLELRCRRGLDPCLRNDLAIVPATAGSDQLADFCHIARSQAQAPARISIALYTGPFEFSDSQGGEQRFADKFV